MKIFSNQYIIILTSFIFVLILMSFSYTKNIYINKINNFPGIKDSINDDSLKYPFNDYSNNPENNKQNSPLFLKNPSAIESFVKYDAKTGKFVFYDKIVFKEIKKNHIILKNKFLFYFILFLKFLNR